MFDYLDWRGDLSFESDPLNAIDLLILATLSYCPMERLYRYMNISGREKSHESHQRKRKGQDTGAGSRQGYPSDNR